jgi:hypothetical protein
MSKIFIIGLSGGLDLFCHSFLIDSWINYGHWQFVAGTFTIYQTKISVGGSHRRSELFGSILRLIFMKS